MGLEGGGADLILKDLTPLRYCRFDLAPGQPTCQHRQGIAQIDHGVNAATEKVGCLHTQIPQKSTHY